MRLFAGTPFDIPPRCEICNELESACQCSKQEKEKRANRIAPEKQTARLSIEKRKKGKVVTVVSGLLSKANDFPEILTKLKNSCGAGGTIQEDTLEIQGEHVDRVREQLVKMGYKVKTN